MIRRLLASCDRRTRTGRRDFAVLIVLSRLGLRAGEVAAIELSDIDWVAGELLVRGKGGRRERLPLPVDVGRALAGYVQRGRPRVPGGRLFLRVKAPAGGLSSSGVSGIVHAACRRCGLPVVGAHRLRHTAATETLRAGASLQEIGQLLRQQSSFTTAIYARVDRDRLRGSPGRGREVWHDPLRQTCDEYLALRRALGFKLTRHGRLLPNLIAYLDAAGETTVTTRLALEWATVPAGHPQEWAVRLSIARGFARYLRTLDGRAEVPPADLLPRCRHRRHRICTPTRRSAG